MNKFVYLIGFLLLFIACGKTDALRTENNNSNGKSGSITRFAIVGDFLYTINEKNIVTFDLEDPRHPKEVGTKSIGLNIETIFAYQNNLYIGASDGIYIVDISNPKDPVVVSKAQHNWGCDPVVVAGNYAYSTVRFGSLCNTNVSNSSLIVYDVSNASYPIEIRQLQMFEPYGLGVQDNYLFVCDGKYGLKLFDISDPTNPQYLIENSLKDIDARDVILDSDLLIVATTTGYYFYNISEISNIRLQSKISF